MRVRRGRDARACLAAGDGSLRFRETLEAGRGIAPAIRLHVVRALHVCRLAAAAWPAYPPDAVLPNYLREPDAKPQMTEDELEIRRLSYADLPQVIAIERRAFPTPWSLAMFVLELSKPSGICLAAMLDERVVGYLVCSRYDTRLARDERGRGRPPAAAGHRHARCSAACSSRRPARRAVHARGPRPRTTARSSCTSASASAPPACRRGYYHDNKEDARDHVADRSGARHRLIPAGRVADTHR